MGGKADLCAIFHLCDRAKDELTVASTLAEPSSVLVAVEDIGAGLDPAVAQHPFEPFFTTKSDGLGMGLAICRSIVESHGGRLWVSPRAPHGADVRFTIPFWEEQWRRRKRRSQVPSRFSLVGTRIHP